MANVCLFFFLHPLKKYSSNTELIIRSAERTLTCHYTIKLYRVDPFPFLPGLRSVSLMGVSATFNRLLIKVLLYNFVYIALVVFSRGRVITCNDISEMNVCNHIIRTCVCVFVSGFPLSSPSFFFKKEKKNQIFQKYHRALKCWTSH